jgi:hypothetical protein
MELLKMSISGCNAFLSELKGILRLMANMINITAIDCTEVSLNDKA